MGNAEYMGSHAGWLAARAEARCPFFKSCSCDQSKMSSVLRSIKTTSLAARNTQLSQRNFSGSGIRLKALKNWSRPSISELGVPSQSWSVVHARNQKRFNLQLLAGISAATVS